MSNASFTDSPSDGAAITSLAATRGEQLGAAMELICARGEVPHPVGLDRNVPLTLKCACGNSPTAVRMNPI